MKQTSVYKHMLKGKPDILNVRQASDILSVSTKTVYKHLNDGSLHSIKVGREFRIPKIYVIDFLCNKDKGI